MESVGLFSIHEQLDALGGRLEIDSAPGRGCRVTLVCPARRGSGETVHPEVELADAAASPTRPRKRPRRSADRIRVAVVDDHPLVRQALAGLLRAAEDMEFAGEAADGASAVTTGARDVRPDVVLMDISMPGMNGIEATRLIDRELPDVSVVCLSMFEEGEQAAAMRAAGAAVYVMKSSGSDAITAAIRIPPPGPQAGPRPINGLLRGGALLPGETCRRATRAQPFAP